jgi:hypothetical protein
MSATKSRLRLGRNSLYYCGGYDAFLASMEADTLCRTSRCRRFLGHAFMQSSRPVTMLYLRSPLSVPPLKTRDVFSDGCPIWCAGQTQWGETIGGYHSVADLPSRDLQRAQLSYAILTPVNVIAFIGVPYASAMIRGGQYKCGWGAVQDSCTTRSRSWTQVYQSACDRAIGGIL